MRPGHEHPGGRHDTDAGLGEQLRCVGADELGERAVEVADLGSQGSDPPSQAAHGAHRSGQLDVVSLRLERLDGPHQASDREMAELLAQRGCAGHHERLELADAPYVALAVDIGASLLTGDRRLAAAPTIPVPVLHLSRS
jgi:hypothetical protein